MSQVRYYLHVVGLDISSHTFIKVPSLNVPDNILPRSSALMVNWFSEGNYVSWFLPTRFVWMGWLEHRITSSGQYVSAILSCPNLDFSMSHMPTHEAKTPSSSVITYLFYHFGNQAKSI